MRNFMQNSAVATAPDKSKPADDNPLPRLEHDFFLDPLPVPHATESNTDTAWGLWEHTLRSYEEEVRDDREEPKHTEFADTVPFDIQALPKKA